MTTGRGVGERGSLSIWMATTSFVMIILVGLAVDLGGQVHAQQHARDVAAQAARVAGQHIDAGRAIQGDTLTIDPAQARAAAREYLAAAGVDGTIDIRGGDTVTVSVSDTYHTQFLSLIDINHLTVTGTATARPVRSIGGTEQ